MCRCSGCCRVPRVKTERKEREKKKQEIRAQVLVSICSSSPLCLVLCCMVTVQTRARKCEYAALCP
jgi:hypothetical protein